MGRLGLGEFINLMARLTIKKNFTTQPYLPTPKNLSNSTGYSELDQVDCKPLQVTNFWVHTTKLHAYLFSGGLARQIQCPKKTTQGMIHVGSETCEHGTELPTTDTMLTSIHLLRQINPNVLDCYQFKI